MREPFPSIALQAGIVLGTIESRRELRLRIRDAREGGNFKDSIEADFLHFTAGIKA